MAHADDVREYCRRHWIEPARARGEQSVSIRASDVHAALKYKNRFPAVCGALGSQRFAKEAGVTRERIDGPVQGASTVFVFKLL